MGGVMPRPRRIGAEETWTGEHVATEESESKVAIPCPATGCFTERSPKRTGAACGWAAVNGKLTASEVTKRHGERLSRVGPLSCPQQPVSDWPN